jgi:tripartite-type tricarboxylate transporter receptor subunit TctC
LKDNPAIDNSAGDSGMSHPRFTRRQWLLGTSALAASAAAPAWAQTANASVRIVVPFAPGGGNDVFARQVAYGLNEAFHRGAYVENRPGAGGNVGTEYVVRAAPDGKTFLLGHTGTMAINPALYQGLKFNAPGDLDPVAMFASSALLLVVPAASPIKTTAQLVQALRGAKSDMNFASSGPGTGGHLTGVLFNHMLGTKAVHIPYKGTAPSLADVAGGQVDFSFSVIPAAMALVKGGKLRALAVTSPKRLQQLPDVPTVAESGIKELKGFESTLTYGILAPKGMPADALRAMSAEVLQVASSPTFQSKLGIEGAEPMLGDAAAYGRLLKEEAAKWGEVVRISGATAS